ncbi:hypothetical protein HanRHA438_Chr02g0059741 [Helianthus annuus]|nr:hypothetical protein HanRHA438_Chr02g0059741 [Helianthus annuus]
MAMWMAVVSVAVGGQSAALSNFGASLNCWEIVVADAAAIAVVIKRMRRRSGGLWWIMVVGWGGGGGVSLDFILRCHLVIFKRGWKEGY